MGQRGRHGHGVGLVRTIQTRKVRLEEAACPGTGSGHGQLHQIRVRERGQEVKRRARRGSGPGGREGRTWGASCRRGVTGRLAMVAQHPQKATCTFSRTAEALL